MLNNNMNWSTIQEGNAISPETGKAIDLQKIFTPAQDSGDLTPRRRKIYLIIIILFLKNKM